MTISSIIKGIGRAADELTTASDDVFKKAVREAPPAQPATPPLAQVEEVENMTDAEFVALLKGAKADSSPQVTTSLAKADELDGLSDEEFLATLKKNHSQEMSPDPNFVDIDPVNMTDAQIEELDTLISSNFPNVSPFDLTIYQGDIAESFAVYKSGLITKDEFIENVSKLTGKQSPDKFKIEDILAGKGPEGTVFENPTKVKEYLNNKFSGLDDLQVSILPDADAIEVAKELEGITSGETVSMRLALNADNIPDGDLSLPFESDVGKTLRAVRGEGMENIPDLIIERLDLLRDNPSANMSTTALRMFITDDEIAAIRIDLTAQEMAAVEFYTFRGDTALNPALRQGLVEPGSTLDATVQEINRALDKLPNKEAVVYRAEGTERFDAYEVGEEITAEAFSSFTLNRLGGKTFKDFKSNPFSGRNTTIVMQSKTGKYIAPLTHQTFEGEQEVLYKAGQKFRVVDKDEATRQVLLEEVE